MPETLLTKQDLAFRWQVCERTVRRLVRRWRVPFDRLTARTVRFRLADVVAVELSVRQWLSRTVHVQPAPTLPDCPAHGTRHTAASHTTGANGRAAAKPANGAGTIRPATASRRHRGARAVDGSQR